MATISGPKVVPGYWRNEQATASEFRGGYKIKQGKVVVEFSGTEATQEGIMYAAIH